MSEMNRVNHPSLIIYELQCIHSAMKPAASSSSSVYTSSPAARFALMSFLSLASSSLLGFRGPDSATSRVSPLAAFFFASRAALASIAAIFLSSFESLGFAESSSSSRFLMMLPSASTCSSRTPPLGASSGAESPGANVFGKVATVLLSPFHPSMVTSHSQPVVVCPPTSLDCTTASPTREPSRATTTSWPTSTRCKVATLTGFSSATSQVTKYCFFFATSFSNVSTAITRPHTAFVHPTGAARI
mmetsp:Transcript_22867/g.38251  ORF Transcript_22867/g.38251 Transcript_22867/m.38251 type:complete len:245 (+) Transcript_22867:191-925(+)